VNENAHRFLTLYQTLATARGGVIGLLVLSGKAVAEIGGTPAAVAEVERLGPVSGLLLHRP
jgi:hypothetical protein